MPTNQFSIGGLIGVHVSSIVYEFNRVISSQFIIFLWKNFGRKKAPKRKIISSPLPRSFCVGKAVNFVVFYLLVFVLLVGFCLWRVFVQVKSFRKKNKDWFEIVLITSSTMLLLLALIMICENILVQKTNMFACNGFHMHCGIDKFFLPPSKLIITTEL